MRRVAKSRRLGLRREAAALAVALRKMQIDSKRIGINGPRILIMIFIKKEIVVTFLRLAYSKAYSGNDR